MDQRTRDKENKGEIKETSVWNYRFFCLCTTLAAGNNFRSSFRQINGEGRATRFVIDYRTACFPCQTVFLSVQYSLCSQIDCRRFRERDASDPFLTLCKLLYYFRNSRKIEMSCVDHCFDLFHALLNTYSRLRTLSIESNLNIYRHFQSSFLRFLILSQSDIKYFRLNILLSAFIPLLSPLSRDMFFRIQDREKKRGNYNSRRLNIYHCCFLFFSLSPFDSRELTRELKEKELFHRCTQDDRGGRFEIIIERLTGKSFSARG